MRIAIDIKAFKNGTTGIARYLRSILDHLQKIDTKNEYFLFECWSSDYFPVNKKWKKIYTPWKLPGILWQQFILPFQLRKYNIEVLWAPEQTFTLFFLGNIKVVTTIYDLGYIHVPKTFQITNLIIQKLFIPFVIKKSSAILPISDYIKNDLKSSFPGLNKTDKLTTITCGRPNWKMPDNYSVGKRGNFLFFAGNQEPRKNLIGLIKALETVKLRSRSIELHLVGPTGWKNKELKKRIEKSPIRNNIKIMGYVTEQELKQEYLSCKALIYPSFYEGFGLPVLEALELDCLILTSGNTVMEDIAEDCAIFFNPLSAEDIANKIEQIYSSDFDRQAYLVNRKKVLDKYSWNKSAQKLLELFTSS